MSRASARSSSPAVAGSRSSRRSAAPVGVPPGSRVSTAPSRPARRAACVDLPAASPPPPPATKKGAPPHPKRAPAAGAPPLDPDVDPPVDQGPRQLVEQLGQD